MLVVEQRMEQLPRRGGAEFLFVKHAEGAINEKEVFSAPPRLGGNS